MGRESVLESFKKVTGAVLLGSWVSMKELQKVSEISIQGLYHGMDVALKSGDVEERTVTIKENGRSRVIRQFRVVREEHDEQTTKRQPNNGTILHESSH